MANSRSVPPEALRPWLTSAALFAPVVACLVQHIRAGQRLVVAYSGGLDSTALLHLLVSLQKASGIPEFSLRAVHVHHGLSTQADAWVTHCQAFCRAWQIPLEIHRVNVVRDGGDGLEAAARQARHAVFAAMPNSDWIVLAHHQDDQAETVLLNILRGAGLAGAAAMQEVNGRLLRPLLKVSRSQILAYAEKAQLSWVDDVSNTNTAHTRNFFRHRIIAPLGERFPAASARLAQAAEHFGEARALLDDLALLDLQGATAGFPVSLSVLCALPEARARNVLRYACAQQGVRIASAARLREFLRQCRSAGPDRHPHVDFGPHRLYRDRARNALCLLVRT